ncbi:kynureninase [Flavobacterium sp. W21_SRS_FM6]|uniref:kynureninase n=1 Tax=Flavobacterium sp. W21_SRS_FM6 TaxID=3240268 RepID=UPI003F92353C
MIDLQHIQNLDATDPLAHKKAEFDLPSGCVYLDGNSLGALPFAAKKRVAEVVSEQWGKDLIKSWNCHQWIDLPQKVGEKIAPLIGAAPGQVICCDSISVNLFKLLCSALAMQKGRNVVLSQGDNFPTDLYMVQGLQDLLGETQCELRICAEEYIEQSLHSDVAVLLLTQVNFRSGQLHNMQRITKLAHRHGILVIWDLAHSAGALPVQLDDCQVDFAVGCGYKYLNGGPGAPAFVYVASRHQQTVKQPLTGWMGHRQPFRFDPEYSAAEGVHQYLSGTPSIVAMSALDAALDVFADINMHQVRTKSLLLAKLCLDLFAQYRALSALTLASPMRNEERGSQLAFAHPQAFAICQALIAQNVICDFRAPDILRIGFTPLYTSYADVWLAVSRLNDVVENKVFKEVAYQQHSKVT